MRAIELRLLARALASAALFVLAGILGLLSLAAAALAFGLAAPAAWAAALGRGLPFLAAAAFAAGVFAVLLRRPGRVYVAALVEKARPELAGALLALAEHAAGRIQLENGFGELLAERVEGLLREPGRDAVRAARAEPRTYRAPVALAGALALGLALAAAGGRRYLEALGEVCGAPGAGPTRIAGVRPGRVELDEGEEFAVECRTAGREPSAVRLLSGAARVEFRRAGDGLWRAAFRPAGSGSYRVQAAARDRLLSAGPFEVKVRPLRQARVVRVVYHYPEYALTAPRESDSPEIDCLAGSTAEVYLATRGEPSALTVQLSPGGAVPAERVGPDLWRARLPVRRVGSYSVWAAPAAGRAEAREVFRGTVTARADLAPTAAARARELPDGRVAVDYRLADDYRLGQARMAFTVAGRRLLYEVPDAAGRREAQGAVLAPQEILAAAGREGFRYRLEAADTHAPEPNRASSPELEFRREPRLALAAGPLLEKKPPLQMAGSHQRPGSNDDGGGSGLPSTTQPTRPLESLYKPGEDESKPSGREGGGGAASPQPPNPYVAPSGGEPEEEPKPGGKPGGKKPGEGGSSGGEKPPPGGNPGEGMEPGAPPPSGPTPKPGGAPPGGEATQTPGGHRPGAGGPGQGPGDGGPGEKPPTGSEKGASPPQPERVLPGKVNMDPKPGEKPAPTGPLPPPLRTDFGQARVGKVGTALGPGEARAPGGEFRPGAPGRSEPVEAGSASPRSAPVDPQYRRYVEEYLNARSAGDQ